VIRSALSTGRNVVSANKGPVAHHYAELRDLARAHSVSYRFESAVADGLPIFSLLERSLPGLDVTSVEGILNSTTAVVLDGVARGTTWRDALAIAEQMGITEADSSYDLDSWDAAVKLAAVAAVVFGRKLGPDEVKRSIPSRDRATRCARAGETDGRRLIQMAKLTRGSDGLQASVFPLVVGPDSPFFNASGATLVVRISSETLQPLVLRDHDLISVGDTV
jgi:homoserine dehydrogenase